MHSLYLNVRAFRTRGSLFTGVVVGELIEMSVWFEVTPYPEDYYQILVKDEDAPVAFLRDRKEMGVEELTAPQTTVDMERTLTINLAIPRRRL